MRTSVAARFLLLFMLIPVGALALREEFLVVMPPAMKVPTTPLGSATVSLTFTDTRGDGVVGRKGSSALWVVENLGPAWSTAVRRALQDAGAVVVAPGADAPWSLAVEVARVELVADMMGGVVDVATSFTLVRGKEQVWRKNFNQKQKISGLSDLGKSISKTLTQVLEDGLEQTGQHLASAGPAAPVAEPARGNTLPQLAVMDFRGALAAATLRLLSDEARSGALEAASGRYLIMTRETVMARLKDKGRCTLDEEVCDTEGAKASGADVVLTGNVVKLGKRLRASIKVTDAKTGALVASRTFSADGEEGLADLVKANAASAVRGVPAP